MQPFLEFSYFSRLLNGRTPLTQPLPVNPTRETIFSPDFPAPDEGDGFAVKPDTWRLTATTSDPDFGRQFVSQSGIELDYACPPKTTLIR